MSTVEDVALQVIIACFYKVSAALALVMVSLCPVRPALLVTFFLVVCAALAAQALDGRCEFSGIKTFTQKLE